MHIDHLNDDPLPLDLWAGHRISARIGRVATTRGEGARVRRQEKSLTGLQHLVGPVSIHGDDVELPILGIVLYQDLAVRDTISQTAENPKDDKGDGEGPDERCEYHGRLR